MPHLFQVGAGSGGMAALDLLARDERVTAVTLVEPDVFKPHNAYRHLFPPSAAGRMKAELAAEWLRERRPGLAVTLLPIDVTAPEHQEAVNAAAARCDFGVCAADSEPAKYHFDLLMRRHGKPWALGEVLSGGIGGWVHRFVPGGACYGCVASHLQREAPGDPKAPPPDYADPGGAVPETTIPASRASISAIASLHALAALQLLEGDSVPPDGAPTPPEPFTSLLVTLAHVPGVFEEPFRALKFRIPRSSACLICSPPPPAAGEDLDAALDQALARLGDG